MENYKDSFINGQHIAHSGAQTGDIFNPSTGERTGITRFASPEQVNACVSIAKEVLSEWSATSPIKRSRVMFRFNELLQENKEVIAKVISLENGKTFNDAMGEVTRGIEIVEYACGIPNLLKGDFSQDVGQGIDATSVRQPLGIVVGITPFNFPAMVPMWMFPIAIACGNVFILKPSEKVPSSSLILAQLLLDSGCPKGVFNVLQGGRDVVDQLLRHEDIAAISFVGSTPVARKIFAEGSQVGKRVQALGGAKNHMVVLPDADIDAATSALMGAAYGSAGQRCMAISVVIVVGDETANLLIEKLKKQILQLQVGDPFDKGVDMGPVISEAHKANIVASINNGVAQGAKLIVDGRSYESNSANKNGFYIGASLFDHVEVGMQIYQEEIFGPVLCIVRAEDYESALELVNKHQFGNGVSIFTESGKIARHFTTNVITGMVGVNIPLPVPVAYHSFGGWKSSLFGSQHIYGPEGINFYTRLKAITTRWHKPNESQFTMPILD